MDHRGDIKKNHLFLNTLGIPDCSAMHCRATELGSTQKSKGVFQAGAYCLSNKKIYTAAQLMLGFVCFLKVKENEQAISFVSQPIRKLIL